MSDCNYAVLAGVDIIFSPAVEILIFVGGGGLLLWVFGCLLSVYCGVVGGLHTVLLRSASVFGLFGARR
jgi:hypothetical protein